MPDNNFGPFFRTKTIFQGAVIAHQHEDWRMYEVPYDALGSDWKVTIAEWGMKNARHVIVVISGVHGLEGPAGSFVQARLVGERWIEQLPPDTGVLLIHGLNAPGCMVGTRSDEKNIDPNRGCCVVFPPPNWSGEEYDRWKYLIEPETLTQAWLDELRISLEGEQGPRLIAEVLAGQYHSPTGLFYGGESLCESGQFLSWISDVLLSEVKHVTVIDLHTGLPKSLIISPLPATEEESIRRLRQRFGSKLVFPLALAGAGTGYQPTGDILNHLRLTLERKGIIVDAVALEMGVAIPIAETFPLLVAANYQRFHPMSALPDFLPGFEERLHLAFFPSNLGWKDSFVRQLKELFFTAV